MAVRRLLKIGNTDLIKEGISVLGTPFSFSSIYNCSSTTESEEQICYSWSALIAIAEGDRSSLKAGVYWDNMPSISEAIVNYRN